MKFEVTAEWLRERYSYDPNTGVFIRRDKGKEVGFWMSGQRYRGLMLGGGRGRMYAVHRLAWLHMTGEWPPETVDHINGDSGDNSWANLRAATLSENNRNTPVRRQGLKGVACDTSVFRRKPWRAAVKVGGKSIHLGRYATEQEAHAAYAAGARKYHGEFGRAE